MRQILVPTIVLFATLAGAMGHAKADTCTVNLIVNPDFEQVYSAQRQAAAGPDNVYNRPDHKTLPKFEDKPVLPYGWGISLSKDEAATHSWVDDAGQKALRIQVPKGELIRMTPHYLEVVPGGVYNFGLWVKGSGRVNLNVWAAEPDPLAGPRQLGQTRR